MRARRDSADFDKPEEATEWRSKLVNAGLEASGKYPEHVEFRLTPDSLERSVGIVREMLKAAYTGD